MPLVPEDKLAILAAAYEQKHKQNRLECQKLLAHLRIRLQKHPHESILEQLLLMCLTNDSEGISRAPFFPHKQQVRELGHKLNCIGGHELMYWVVDRLPLEDQRELEVLWDGIGTWRC